MFLLYFTKTNRILHGQRNYVFCYAPCPLDGPRRQSPGVASTERMKNSHGYKTNINILFFFLEKREQRRDVVLRLGVTEKTRSINTNKTGFINNCIEND